MNPYIPKKTKAWRTSWTSHNLLGVVDLVLGEVKVEVSHEKKREIASRLRELLEREEERHDTWPNL